MPYYAQITNGIVTAVTETSGAIVAANMVAIGSLDISLIGHRYDGSVFTAPARSPLLSQQAFWRRWTRAEREAFQDVLGVGAQPQKNKVGAFRDYLRANTEIDLSDREVIDGLMALPPSVLSNARAVVIATP